VRTETSTIVRDNTSTIVRTETSTIVRDNTSTIVRTETSTIVRDNTSTIVRPTHGVHSTTNQIQYMYEECNDEYMDDRTANRSTTVRRATRHLCRGAVERSDTKAQVRSALARTLRQRVLVRGAVIFESFSSIIERSTITILLDQTGTF
jgi:phosphoenolpyruvate-protein kinase (PTS system EI component)